MSVLRPLSIGELLDRSFAVYRHQFLVFMTLAAVPALLVFAAQVIIIAMASKSVGVAAYGGTPSLLRLAMATPAVLLACLALSVAYLFLSAAAHGAAVQAASAGVMGEATSVARALGTMKGNTIRAAVVLFVTGLLTALGFILLIVPGILLGLRWALVLPSTILERTGVSKSLSRSSFLTEGCRGRIFLILVLYSVVLYALATVIEMPIVAAMMATTIRNGGASPEFPFWYLAATYGSSVLVSALVTPILLIALTLQYYDSRIRKEAFDLQVLMGNATAAAPGI
ncbi:MAG: glycerophosphoryl diester phosphodiesterase membrane domain-containing protein [Acidobacteria bacterium]|nr:glycerophosphoryl diester phosphodiesterase membrane domain-containing protein [Acidobacteriota bacterium]